MAHSSQQDTRLMWALTFIGAAFLFSVLPNVSWFTPGSAGRYRALFFVLTFGAAYYAWRLRLWPVVIGGVGLVWLTSTAAHAADPGG